MMSSLLLLFIPYNPYIDIEHGPVEIVHLPMQNCDFPSSYVSLPEGDILCYPHSCWLNPYESL